MSEQTAVVVKKVDAPAEWGARAEIGALAERFAIMLPGAKDMSRDELLTAAQYCRMMDLNPFRGEVYFYKSKGKLAVVDGYKALARWAREKAPYSEWIELLPLEEGQIAHVRVWILRDDRKAMLHEFMGMGATFSEAREMAAHYADGVVTEGDLRAKDGVKEPPVGWTWEQVARKRAFKNAINLSHGAPSPREIARMSWEVNGTHTRPEDWDGAEELSGLEAEKLAELRARGRENMERIAEMSPEELQEKAEANGRILYGDPAFEGFDTPTVTAPPAFEEEPEAEQKPGPEPEPPKKERKAPRVVTVLTKRWPAAALELVEATGDYYRKGDQVDWFHLTGAALKLGFESITDANLNLVIDALRSHAGPQEEQLAAELAAA